MKNIVNKTRPRPKRRLEAGIHFAIWRYLRIRGVLAYTFYNEQVFSRKLTRFMPNGPDRPAGIPDIICKLKNGMSFWIEVKSAKGVVSHFQKQRHAELAEWGWPVFICKSVDDVEQLLKDLEGKKE